MLHPQRIEGLDKAVDGLRGLPRCAEHQVDRDVPEARRLRHPHAFLRLRKAVPAAQCLQLAVRGGLHPHRDAVKAPFPQRLQLGKGHGGGVCLQRDLAFRLHRKVPPHRGQNLQKSLSQQHRRAAAKVDAVHRLPRCGGRFHRPHRRPHILLRQLLAVGQRVEVAVGALGKTERDMDIDSQHPQILLFPFWLCSYYSAFSPDSPAPVRAAKEARPRLSIRQVRALFSKGCLET